MSFTWETMGDKSRPKVFARCRENSLYGNSFYEASTVPELEYLMINRESFVFDHLPSLFRDHPIQNPLPFHYRPVLKFYLPSTYRVVKRKQLKGSILKKLIFSVTVFEK